MESAGLDSLALARIQFAANISFHILFPSITIALAWILLFFKLRFNKTHDIKWMEAYQFWVKIFALSFALGVVSGITMSFQFGTNWPGYMNKVGNIAGPLLAYEVLTAFFMEATFLGIMLFGFRRVSRFVHTLATLLVALGTSLSAFWIIALNSWMHTPAGFEMIDGKAHVTNWLSVVFNPSMPYRLVHVMLASGLTAGFLVAGISAFRWVRNDCTPAVLAALKTGVFLTAILIPLQIFAGDQHGLNTLKHQPAKIAAMEAVWETEKNVPLMLFALPNKETKKNDMAVAIPGLASLILTHSLSGEIKGLNEFPDHPPVAPVFWAFRVMVAVGMLMLAVSWFAAFQFIKRKTINNFTAKLLVGMTFAGWVAVLAGWYTTEIGRQPYLVYGVLRTADAVGPVSSPFLGITLTMYLILYAVLATSYIAVVFYLAKTAYKKKLDEKAFSSAAITKKAKKKKL